MVTYTDLLKFETFEERLEFLKTNTPPSELNFGELRFLNQKFYSSRAWRIARQHVIARDLGYDLGIPGLKIFGKIIVHHMNPIGPKDVLYHGDIIVDPEFLITVSDDTHKAIHFGVPARERDVDRYPGDTKIW